MEKINDYHTHFKVKEIRDLFNLSQAEAAQKLGLTQVVYEQIESGEIEVTADIMKQLTEFYSVPSGYFVNEIKLEEIEHLKPLIKMNSTIKNLENEIREARELYNGYLKGKN